MTRRRIYRGGLACLALTVLAFCGTIVLHGGWQPVAAAVGMAAGIATVVTFTVLEVAGERPRPRYPGRASPIQ